MARLWQLGVDEVRPGTYFRTSSGDVTVEGATNGIVALIYKGTWGPLNTVVDIRPEDLNNLEEIVGTGAGNAAARQALIGGAKIVRSVRVGTGGARAYRDLRAPDTTKTVTNADGTKTTTTVKGDKCIRIYAKYAGVWDFYVTIKKNLITGKRQALFYHGGKLIDSVEFSAGSNDSSALVNAINNNAKFFTAKRIRASQKLKVRDCTQAAVTYKGVDPTVRVSSYSASTEILESYRWNVIIAATNSAEVHDVLVSFVRQSYEVGQLGMTVIGGISSNAFADRVAYAASINDWRAVFLLNGFVDNLGTVRQGYQSAARLAGMIAACETNAAITHLVIQDALRLNESLTYSQIEDAQKKGCVVLSLNDSDQVWADNAINTLITLGNDQDDGWKKIRRTKCRFELMDRINRTCDKLVGRLNNDARGRATILAAMTTVIREMIAERKLIEGSYAMENPNYISTADKAYFKLVIGDYDSMEKFYLDFCFSYANPFDENVIA